MENNIDIKVNKNAMEVDFKVKLTAQDGIPSKTGKSIVLAMSGFNFTKIPDTNLLYKLIVVQDKKAFSLFPDEDAPQTA
jgi:hypothetical protein